MSGKAIPSQLDSMEPRNVEQITNASQVYEYNAQIPLRYWLRTAAALLKEAEIYMREGDEETTYLLLYRHAHLVLGNLQAHPEAKGSNGQIQLGQAKKDVNKNLKVLDLLKPRINRRYERYTALARDRDRLSRTRDSAQNQEASTGIATHPSSTGAQPIHGYEHSELAVELANREKHRRAHLRQAEVKQQAANNDTSSQVQAIQMLAEKRRATDPNLDGTAIGIGAQVAPTYQYPTVRNHQPQEAIKPQPYLHRQIYQQPGLMHDPSPPAKPPKDRFSGAELPPVRPEKTLAAVRDERSQSGPIYTFTSSASLENGTRLRTLFLPPTLRTTFLRLAHKNTQANLETCAFLAGTLISNALFVSKLVLPAQVATSDTCEMTNESQLFDYVDNEKDLMVLGWIHTHPSQTCFMSSRDLHTHAGYQMMLAESIAIVCAPSKGDTTHGGDWGVYRLTDPPGKMAILNCTRPGIFHPHDVDNIYTDALRPGHVVEATGLEFEVVDLRDS